jgi:hypothetical protein
MTLLYAHTVFLPRLHPTKGPQHTVMRYAIVSTTTLGARMDYEKLLFAAEVRKLAVELQQAERSKVEHEYAKAEAADRQDALDAWGNEFPLSTFVTRANSQIVAVLEQLEAEEEQERRARTNASMNAMARTASL